MKSEIVFENFFLISDVNFHSAAISNASAQWHTEGRGVQTPPPPKILKSFKNRAKLNPIVKTVKNC